MARQWINIADQRPKEGQEVFYYFRPVGVHAGHYRQVRPPEQFAEYFEEGAILDVFFSLNGGFLVDDVSHWMEREEGDSLPDDPEVEKSK